MKKKELNQKQRLIVAIIYVIIIIATYFILTGSIEQLIHQNEPESVWFFSGILLVILGKYVSEPYFSSPCDAFTNSLSLIIFLITISHKNNLYGYIFLLIYSICIFLISFFHMIFKELNEKYNKISFMILKSLGSSTILFSFVYILASFSYFKYNYSMLIAALLIWILMVPFDLLSYIVFGIGIIFKILKDKESGFLGIAVHNSEYEYYTIEVIKTDKKERLLKNNSEVLYLIKTDCNSYSLSICSGKNNLIDAIWINLFLLEKEFKYDIETIKKWGIVLSKNEKIGTTYLLSYNELPQDVQIEVLESNIYRKKNNLVGFVLADSNLNAIKFKLCDKEERIREGVIVETSISGENVLFQVINGITKSESIRGDNETGFMCVIARKIGKYNVHKNEIEAVNWTPRMSEPVYLCDFNENVDCENIAKTAIGRLPGSDMKIPIKDINSLITHNTAILGILGVGKSCLTFELIKKIVDEGKKVICLDITNQYCTTDGLYGYLDEKIIQNDFDMNTLNYLEENIRKDGNSDNPSTWGNVDIYKEKLSLWIGKFLEGNNKKVFIMNPDNHKIMKAGSLYKIQNIIDVSLVEKVQLISECILKKCMDMGQTNEARCCVVYEEAHSLTPEFNSVVIKDDSNHANGTAKVILQGRKFGLGCIIVTQRTANVTKSILNQCNTIFALRVFDDTGKTFLENYIGKDYSDVLPTLEERHAVVIGKGIGLKQPIIVQLNDSHFLKRKDL